MSTDLESGPAGRDDGSVVSLDAELGAADTADGGAELPPTLPRLPTEPIMDATGAPAPGDTPLLRRQLAAARAEVQALLGQVAHMNRLRATVLEKDQSIEAMKVWLVNIQSERDQAVEIAAERHGSNGTAVAAEAAPDTGPESELESLRERLVTALEERDAALEKARQVVPAEPVDDDPAVLSARIDELEASVRAARKMSDTAEQKHHELLIRHREQADETARVEAERQEASQRAERLKVALERLRTAFVRVSEQAQQVPQLEEELAGLRSSFAEAPEPVAAPDPDAERELEEARAASEASGAERDAALERSAELEARVAELEAQLAAPRPDAAEADGEVVDPDELAAVREALEAAEQRFEEAVRGRFEAEAATQDALAAREAAQERIGDLEAALEQAGTRTGGADERVTELEAQLQDAAAAAEASRAQIGELEAALAEAGTATESAAAADEAAQQRIVELEAALEQASAGAETAASEADERAAELQATVEETSTAWEAAQTRIGELEAALEQAAEAGDGAGVVPDQRVPELEAKIEELTAALDSAARSAQETSELKKRYKTLQGRARELATLLNELRGRNGGDAGTGGVDTAELEALKVQVQRSSAQIQRYLLELEGSKGTIARTRAEVERYGRSVVGLHEGINHLHRYLQEAGAPGQQALVLLQEVKRCASEIRTLVESNERFGRAMSDTISRLGTILIED